MIRRLVLSTLILSAFFSGLLMCALREPSLGPCFGRKGGATGGGRR